MSKQSERLRHLPWQKFDTGEMAAPAESGHEKSGRTLFKDANMSLVTVTVEPGGSVAAHSSHGPALIQVLKGEVDVRVGGDTVSVKEGEILALSAGRDHDVHARERSVLLLTLTTPG